MPIEEERRFVGHTARLDSLGHEGFYGSLKKKKKGAGDNHEEK